MFFGVGVDFGVGVGWLREEFEAVAMPFEKRGQRTDEHLAVMKALWTDEVSEFHGELYDLPPGSVVVTVAVRTQACSSAISPNEPGARTMSRIS